MTKILTILLVIITCAGLWFMVCSVIDLGAQIDGMRYIQEGYDARDKVERQMLKDALTDKELKDALINLGIKIPVKKK